MIGEKEKKWGGEKNRSGERRCCERSESLREMSSRGEERRDTTVQRGRNNDGEKEGERRGDETEIISVRFSHHKAK